MDYIIIKSGKSYWNGKCFSSDQAKVYEKPSDAFESLQNWHFVEDEDAITRPCKVSIRVISQAQKDKLASKIAVDVY